MADVKIRVDASLTIDGSNYEVLRYELVEALSEPSVLECEVMQQAAEPAHPHDLIDQTATLHLEKSDGSQQRDFVGRVVRAGRIAAGDDVRTVQLTVAPVPWALGKRADCRVFQKLSVVDIAKQVLSAAGIGADHQDWRTRGTHSKREYVVQYRERDLDFLQRIFAEEGIYWAVHHVGGKDLLVVGDQVTGLGDAPVTNMQYFAGQGFEEAIDAVMRLSQTSRVTTDKVTLRDYNFLKPKLEVESTVESTDPGGHVLEVYDYPARGVEPPDAKRLAEVLLDELAADKTLVRGETGTLALAPGLAFSIENHPYAPLNQKVLVTRVRIAGEAPRLGARQGAHGGRGYRCEWTAIPAKVHYRPPARPRAAQMVGLQVAVTTGAGGEEIHPNEHGEVKLSYPWDRLGPKDDGSSRWVRTTQLALGESMLLPRVGWEVSAAHEEGDPDRPLVLGRMYNAQKRPPYKLPDEAVKSSVQTATSPGGGSVNEMRMSDGKGSEEMHFNASKDMTVDVKNNTTEHIGANRTHSVGSNLTKEVTNSVTASVGGSQKVSVDGNQNVSISTKHQDEVKGDHSLHIGGNRNMKIGGDHKLDVGGDSNSDISGRRIDLVVGSVTYSVLGDYNHDVSSALIDITTGDRTLTVGGDITEAAGAAKIVATRGGRGVDVGGGLTQKVGGAVIHIASADRAEEAGGSYTEVAAGAHIVKANNIVIEADSMLTLMMGAAILNLTPASVTVMGASIKLDGDVVDEAGLVLDN